MDAGESSFGHRQKNQAPEVTLISTSKVTIYGTDSCGYCTAARTLLKKKGVDYDEVLVSRDDDTRQEMERLSGRRTVPQIFINDQPIGGFDELYRLDKNGELDKLLGRLANDNTI